MTRRRNRPQLLAWITLGAITIILIVSITVSFLTFHRLSDHTDATFSTDTKALTQNILGSVRQYETILYDARSFLTTHPDMTQATWRNHFTSKNIYDSKGISSISYIELIPHANKDAFVHEARASGDFSPTFTIRPAGDRDEYAVARWVSSSTDVSQALGFDVFSTADRRDVYDTSEKYNRPVASEPFVFATGVSGFFITLPLKTTDGTTKGFITMSFRTADFMAELMRKNSSPIVATRITDITNNQLTKSIYESDTWQSGSSELMRSDTVTFSGRYWSIEMKSARGYKDSLLNYTAPRAILLGGGALVLCIVIAYAIAERKRGGAHK